MQKSIVLASVIFLSIAGYLLVSSSNLKGFSSIVSLVPIVFALGSLIFSRLYVTTARVVLPITYGIFALALFSVGYENIAGSDFYNVSTFGIDQENFKFEAEDNFFNAITVLFSVVSAFLLWKGLTDFDDLKIALNEEAEKIWAIVFLTSYLREKGDKSAANIQNIKATDNIRNAFKSYLETAIGVSEIEKKSREKGLKRLRTSDDVIDKCVEETKKIIVKPGDENDRIALEEIMKNLSSLVSIRSRRRVCMDTSMPPFVLGSILIMSISVLLPFFGNGADTLSVNHIYVFLLSAIHMFIFMTLLDLSAPFDGHFSIGLEAFVDAKNRIDGLIKSSE